MAAEGYLICAVYTANAQLPVPGALVTILKRDTGSASQLLANPPDGFQRPHRAGGH
ncbi:MAG: hypothetical protein V8S89_07550 [Oscillospiraceae bacterium]